jgi:hypothetical protein
MIKKMYVHHLLGFLVTIPMMMFSMEEPVVNSGVTLSKEAAEALSPFLINGNLNGFGEWRCALKLTQKFLVPFQLKRLGIEGCSEMEGTKGNIPPEEIIDQEGSVKEWIDLLEDGKKKEERKKWFYEKQLLVGLGVAATTSLCSAVLIKYIKSDSDAINDLKNSGAVSMITGGILYGLNKTIKYFRDAAEEIRNKHASSESLKTQAQWYLAEVVPHAKKQLAIVNKEKESSKKDIELSSVTISEDTAQKLSFLLNRDGTLTSYGKYITRKNSIASYFVRNLGTSFGFGIQGHHTLSNFARKYKVTPQEVVNQRESVRRWVKHLKEKRQKKQDKYLEANVKLLKGVALGAGALLLSSCMANKLNFNGKYVNNTKDLVAILGGLIGFSYGAFKCADGSFDSIWYGARLDDLQHNKLEKAKKFLREIVPWAKGKLQEKN